MDKSFLVLFFSKRTASLLVPPFFGEPRSTHSNRYDQKAGFSYQCRACLFGPIIAMQPEQALLVKAYLVA
jgi:hypothetical protein